MNTPIIATPQNFSISPASLPTPQKQWRVQSTDDALKVCSDAKGLFEKNRPQDAYNLMVLEMFGGPFNHRASGTFPGCRDAELAVIGMLLERSSQFYPFPLGVLYFQQGSNLYHQGKLREAVVSFDGAIEQFHKIYDQVAALYPTKERSFALAQLGERDPAKIIRDVSEAKFRARGSLQTRGFIRDPKIADDFGVADEPIPFIDGLWLQWYLKNGFGSNRFVLPDICDGLLGTQRLMDDSSVCTGSGTRRALGVAQLWLGHTKQRHTPFVHALIFAEKSLELRLQDPAHPEMDTLFHRLVALLARQGLARYFAPNDLAPIERRESLADEAARTLKQLSDLSPQRLAGYKIPALADSLI